VGPVVTLATANVDVNQFDESGAGSANLRIGSQKRRSEVWGIGVRASATFGAWTPWLRITADKERRDDARFVTASPLSLATGNTYELPAYRADNNFVTTNIGINGLLAPNIALGVAYYKLSSRTGIKEDGIAGTLSVKF
jgi:uncharacterized protein YhjY with autotransporter beta-barrel domain